MNVHPSQISPAENFDISYFIRNHTDSTTYYVRGVVYDMRTGEVLLTTNLDQAATNSRLFIKTVQAPPDPVGIGRNILAVATVYTDSGYTTKSPDYEEQEQYFLIKAEAPTFGGGGGIDYRALREMIREELANGISTIPRPDPVDLSFVDAIFGTLGVLQREVNRIPKEYADYTPFTEAIDQLRRQIAAIPKTDEPDEVDLEPIIAKLAKLTELVRAIPIEHAKAGAALLSGNDKTMKDMTDRITADVQAAIKDLLSRQELTIPLEKLFTAKPPEQKERSVKDFSHLMDV